MLPAATPPEAGAEGFLIDLEFAHLGRSSLDTMGGMTASTVRSHTIFEPDVMRGAVTTVRLPQTTMLLIF